MATHRDRLVEYHINKLKDKRGEVRLESIRQLVLLEAIEALESLQDVFANDTDAEVRKAAQEAGRKIFREHKLKGQQAN